MKRTISVVALVASINSGALSQGVPVIDVAAIANMVQQLQQAQQQFQQLQQTHNSFNHLTSMGDIATVLNNPAVRNALPKDFASVEGALMGQGGTADTHRQADAVWTPGGNDYYAQELARSQGANAGQKSVAEQMYTAAGKRMDGIKELQAQIGQSEDPKTIADLSARLQVEMVAAQTDTVRMQALAMVQQAEAQVREQRAREKFEQTINDNVARLGGTPSATN